VQVEGLGRCAGGFDLWMAPMPALGEVDVCHPAHYVSEERKEMNEINIMELEA